MTTLLLLALGLVGLWIGTELALRSTIALAEALGLPPALLGATLLAVGSDLPELVVAIAGGVRQLQGVEASGLVVGNAIGSAITQGSLVLGIAGLVGTLRLAPRALARDGVALGLALALLVTVGSDGAISRVEGAVLILGYAAYAALLVLGERSRHPRPRRAPIERRVGLRIAAGLVVVLVSAELVVSSALELSDRWATDPTAVGVLLIGAGTSLPELALSLGAAAKGRPGLSVGNVIGSNLFDLLVPIGASALLHPLAVPTLTLALDLPVLLLVVVLGLAFFARRRGLQRPEAVALVGLWVGFALVRLLLLPGAPAAAG